MAKTKHGTSGYEDVLDDFMTAHGLTECELSDAMLWGIQTGRLKMSPQGQLSYHMPRARRALREKKFVTPSGRTVREWHHRKILSVNPLTGQSIQRDLWGNICQMSDHAFLDSLRQRCQAVKVDVSQIKKDRDGFNELQSQKGLPHIQLRISYSYR